MTKQKVIDGLAAVAALVIILGVGSAAKSAFADSVNPDLNSGVPTTESK